MPIQSDIAQQQQRLARYRATLAHHLNQRAQLGTAHEPPSVASGIQEARVEIRRCKAILRSWGVAVEELPDDIDPTLAPDVVEDLLEDTNLAQPAGIALLARRPIALQLGGLALAVLVLVAIVVLFALRPQNTVIGDGNILNTGTIGQVIIQPGDTAEVRRQKADQAKRLIVSDVLANSSALDARLSFANAALVPAPDPLEVVRQTVSPAGAATAAAGYRQLISTQQIAALRQSFNSRPLRLEFGAPLIQVLVDSGADPSTERFFYEQLTAANDAAESLLTTMESATRNTPDQRATIYWNDMIKLAHDRLTLRSTTAYIAGLRVLGDIGATPDELTTLSALQVLTPRQPLTETAYTQALATIGAAQVEINNREGQLAATATQLRMGDVATYTAADDSLVIHPDDTPDQVAVKAAKLRRLGRAAEALAGFDRYAQVAARDPTTEQYVRTARALTDQMQALGVLGGVYLFAVAPNSLGQRAGLQVGDILLSYNGAALVRPDDLVTAIDTGQVDTTVRIEWLRLGVDRQFSRMNANVSVATLGVGAMSI